MAAFKSFEEIQAWQKARALTDRVYALPAKGAFAKDFVLVDQIRRAAISVMSNISEGLARGRPAEFIQFLRIARGSASEVKAQLYIALDQGYIDESSFESRFALADETSRMLSALITYLGPPHDSLLTTDNSQLTTRRAKPQRGFALPAAIFLLVVLGGLAGWLMRMTETSLAQDVLELEGERAYQAAQAGLEAGIYAARNGSCAGLSIAFTGNLSRFAASVTCTPYTADEGGTAVALYEVISVACNQPAGGACPNGAPTLHEYTERHVRALVEGG